MPRKQLALTVSALQECLRQLDAMGCGTAATYVDMAICQLGGSTTPIDMDEVDSLGAIVVREEQSPYNPE